MQRMKIRSMFVNRTKRFIDTAVPQRRWKIPARMTNMTMIASCMARVTITRCFSMSCWRWDEVGLGARATLSVFRSSMLEGLDARYGA